MIIIIMDVDVLLGVIVYAYFSICIFKIIIGMTFRVLPWFALVLFFPFFLSLALIVFFFFKINLCLQ